MRTAFALVAISTFATLATACSVPVERREQSGSPQATGAGEPADPSGPSSGTDDAEDRSLDPVYTLTIVTNKEDGSSEIKTRPIALSEQVARNKLREAAAAGIPIEQTLAHDPGCSATSEQLWSNVGKTGDTICFNHPAQEVFAHDLRTLPRGTPMICGGQSIPRSWSGGVYACIGGVPQYSAYPGNDNYVRSIETGTNPNEPNAVSGVEFNRVTFTGVQVFDSAFPGTDTTYPDVHPRGAFVVTSGVPIWPNSP